jgi:hypothetical protein
MEDVLSFLIYRLPALAFALLFVLTLAIPALHSLVAVARVLTGRRAKLNWWVIGRVLPLVLAAIVAVPLLMFARTWTADWQLALAEIALVYLCVAVIVTPVALPLVQAYATRQPRLGTLAYAVLAILALPVAATLATQASALATEAIDVQRAAAGAGIGPYAFRIDESPSRCAETMARAAPDGIVYSLPAADAALEATYPPYFFFWADMTAKAVALDFFEVFECNLTNLRHNPDHLLLSSFVFFYRAFVSIIVLAVLALPFRRSSE